MKKITVKALICLVLTVIVALSLFACSGQPANNSADTDNGSSAVGGNQGGTNQGGTNQGDAADTGNSGNSGDSGDTPTNYPSREDFYAQEQLVIYPELPEQIHRNYDYKVTVTQGTVTESIPVYNHTMEYDVSGRSIGGDLYRRFSQFAFSGKKVRVDIKVNRDFEYYSVFPSAKNFETEYNGGVISVYLDEPDYFGIRLDDDDNSILSIFADLPEYPGDIPVKSNSKTVWIDGWHDVDGGILYLTEPNTHLYIAPGAVLNGRVDIRGENTKITGRGVILDAFENIYKLDIRDGGTESHGIMLCQIYGPGSVFDGPVLLDARCYNIMGGSEITVKNYKALSSMMTTDGITAGGKNATYEHCWIYCGDNAMVLSGASNHVYRDIALGTTCAAIFPQNDTTNLLLEDIYVFRSNDGIVTNAYNGGTPKKDRSVEVTIKNLDCMDCINVPRFFRGASMGLLKKTLVFDGVSLPLMSGVTNPHKISFKGYDGQLIYFENPESLFTENYHITFNNLYVGGERITDSSQVKIEGDYNNTVIITTNGDYTPVIRATHKVDYKGINRVYIGSYLLALENDILVEDDLAFLLPAEEILSELRSTKTPETVDRGMPYVTPDALLAAGAIESFEIKDGNLYLTPVYNGRNLLLADEGVLPQISEAECYKVDMVTEDNDGDYIYYLYDLRNYYAGGFSIMFTEEIKKYGAGTYEFSFRARGAAAGGVLAAWRYDNINIYVKNETNQTLTTAWKDITIKLIVTEDMLNNSELFAVSVLGNGSPLEYFAVKELELIKK